MGEATVPAEHTASGQKARLSTPDVDAGGASHPPCPPPEGPGSSVGLTTAVGDDASVGATRRVRERAVFARLASGHRVRQGPLTVTFAPTTSPGPPQVAYSVSRSVGTAVGRNRVRRQLRALMRTMPLRSGAYLVTAAPQASGRSSAEFRHWMTLALTRLERAGG